MAINVYYLDDEAMLCDMFLEYFSSDQVSVMTFLDGNMAIEACSNNPPDLIFIDYRLPGITGDQVASAIDKRIPKILVTGELSVSTDYKFEQVISKPFDFKSVKNIIASYER